MDPDDLHLAVIWDLDHDPIAQRYIQAGGIEMVLVVGRHHGVQLAQPADLVIRNQHRVISNPSAP
jgi:hypothetical protein